MTKRYSIAEAREHLSEMMHEVEEGNSVELTRSGKPVAILLPVDDRDRSSGRFWDSYQKLRRDFDFTELAIDPDIVFSSSKDPSPGRDFSW